MDVIVVASQELGLTVSEKKTEVMHLWSLPNTASNALRIEATGQRYKHTTEFVECFNDWRGRGCGDCVPEEVTKTSPSGDRTT